MARDPKDSTGIDHELARLAAATSDLEADPRLSEAVSSALCGVAWGAGDVDALLARAAGATADMAPDAALTDAVMARVGTEAAAPASPRSGAEDAPIADGVARTGPWALAFAAVAAAACALLSVQTEREVDRAIVSSVEMIEVGE